MLNGELKLDEVSDEAKELVKLAYAQSSALRLLYLQQSYIDQYQMTLLNKTFVERDLNRVFALKKQLEGVRIAYNDTTRAISAKTKELRKAWNTWTKKFGKEFTYAKDYEANAWQRIITNQSPKKYKQISLLEQLVLPDDQLYSKLINNYSGMYQRAVTEGVKAGVLNKRDYKVLKEELELNQYFYTQQEQEREHWERNTNQAQAKMQLGETIYSLIVVGEILKDVGNQLF